MNPTDLAAAAEAPPVIQPPQPVGARRCATCACFYVIPNAPAGSNAFCGRDPPRSSPVRMERPRIGTDGKPVIVERKNEAPRPVMESVQGFGYAHTPTLPDLVCYEGYRPIGTLPGERGIEARNRRLLQSLLPLGRLVVEEAKADAPPPIAARLEALASILETALADEPPAANDAAAPGVPAAEKTGLNS